MVRRSSTYSFSVATRGDELIGDLLQDLLPAGQPPQDLVTDLARLHGLLDLAWDDDVSRSRRS